MYLVTRNSVKNHTISKVENSAEKFTKFDLFFNNPAEPYKEAVC